MRAHFVAALLASVVAITRGGVVISRPLRQRADGAAHADRAPTPPSSSAEPDSRNDELDLAEFTLQLQRLRRSSSDGAGALRKLLEYLDSSSRKVCVWDPAFTSLIATADGGLSALQAAGFDEMEKDENGTPFLVLNRATTHKARRQLVDAVTTVLREAEDDGEVEAATGDAGKAGDVAAEVAHGRLAALAMAATASAEGGGGGGGSASGGGGGGDGMMSSGDGRDGDRDGDEEDEEDEGSVAPETELVRQISSMISGLISELERQTSGGGGFNATGDATDGTFNDTQSQSPPIHFRVYRSPSGFPGFPPGGGLPFLPGGLGGGMPSGDSDEDGEVAVLERRLRAASLPTEADEVATRELKRLRRMSPMHSEYSTLVDYLEWLADLPWANATVDRLTISSAREQLESDHFGMEKVKARVLEYLSVCKLKGDLRGSILCLLGPPGIGKTSLGRSIADALHRDFYRVSLGGVHSEAEIRGHRRTYVGAMPGLILQALKKCRTNNCVIMLDEIDKLGRNSLNGDPSSALLEVLDPEQNHAFRDHFLNLPFNLSRVLFIATANEMDTIPRPLRDRMEVIEMSGYTVQEKVQIATRHLLPKQRRQHGLREGDLTLDIPTVDALIEGYTLEAGVRELDRQLAALCRSKAAKAAEAAERQEDAAAAADAAAASSTADSAVAAGGVGAAAEGGADAVADGGAEAPAGAAAGAAADGGAVSVDDLVTILGPPKFDGPKDNVYRVSKPGVAVGLAYTPVGGDVLYIEAEKMAGRGELVMTGKLGEVMSESVKIAVGWVRAHAAELGIQLEGGSEGSSLGGSLLNGTDLHLHFPAGAMPKDGPSAGVTITTAIVSLLTGRRVRSDLAMTGELTLRGLVLPVGGIKEKLIAAHRAGMTHVLIPAKNEKDLRELPPSVLEGLNVTLVKEVGDVLAAALMPLEHPQGDAPRGTGGSELRKKRSGRTLGQNPASPSVPLPMPSARLGGAGAGSAAPRSMKLRGGVADGVGARRAVLSHGLPAVPRRRPSPHHA